jgi:fumarylacetoacetase
MSTSRHPRSWVTSANDHPDFALQNLPFGVFSRLGKGMGTDRRGGVAIGDCIFDLRAALEASLFTGVARVAAQAASRGQLNDFFALGPASRQALRNELMHLLDENSPQREHLQGLGKTLLLPMSECRMHLPATVGDYTDFYVGIHHAMNVGRLFRPDNPLLPNYKYVPIAYHGRASTLCVSGTPVKRPNGQTLAPGAEVPTVGPSKRLDYELEVGVWMGQGNEVGEPISIAEAGEHIAGFCLLNDWSARDLQAWEYQPLGPFLAKSFATSLAPWVVTLDALAPFRTPAFARPAGDPEPLPYLLDAGDQAHGGFDITLEVRLCSRIMRDAGSEPVLLSRGNFADMYWTIAQLLTHHASNGCNLRPGDVLASGTVSGPDPDARGCLLELTSRGAEPLTLPSGETRRFLDDGDEVLLRGYCEAPGARRIGFGECRGVVLPAEQ